MDAEHVALFLEELAKGFMSSAVDVLKDGELEMGESFLEAASKCREVRDLICKYDAEVSDALDELPRMYRDW